MDCTICGKPITLVPSAAERAKKYGGKPSDYTKLFTAHSTCEVEKRSAASVALMRRLAKES
jgi:DNA-binding ferritin-like protein